MSSVLDQETTLTEWTGPGPLGAHIDRDTCTFRVWAPNAERVEVHIRSANNGSSDRRENLQPEDRGYFAAILCDVGDSARYTFILDGGNEQPDPASRLQPDGVHESSQVFASDFAWNDSAWKNPGIEELIIQEIHVGTFTPEGTFAGVISQLDRLKRVGINAIELLPVSQFPGNRNWGYDGVYPFAVQNSYGGPRALKQLVDAAHQAGIAVILDVVYNHIGPEGNYLPDYAPYFTERYKTPWGASLNFDDASSDEVRAFFIQSALQWIDEFHIDGLRFDAVHAIIDASARPFLAEITDALRERARHIDKTVHLIAESDLSDPRMISPTGENGFGFDAQWLDDFHHAIHALVTAETQGYYADYGDLQHLVTTLERAYVYAGHYSAHRGRRHGAPLDHVDPRQFVVCAQNHDQIGNRLAGDRLSTLVDFDTLKMVAALTLLGPYVPMLFMGEEYGEESPFPYFVSHGDPQLIEAVRKGRKEEFKSFGWSEEPPDPQSEETFRSAILHPERAQHGKHRALLALHRDLIALRRKMPQLHDYDRIRVGAEQEKRTLMMTREKAGTSLLLAANFGDGEDTLEFGDDWYLVIATDDARYAPDLAADLDQGPLKSEKVRSFTLTPHAAVLLMQEPA